MRAKIRQRRGVGWAAVAPVAAAVALVTAGCGQAQLGAAALYGGQRVSSTTLADEVANLNAAYQVYKSKVQISYTPAQMPQQVLTWMLRFATADRVATREGISVTHAQAQAQLGLEAARARQNGDTLREVAVLSGLPPDMLPQVGRWLAIQNKLASLLNHGVPPTTAAEQAKLGQAINHQSCLAAKSLNIKVNPQYGGYDYASLIVVPMPTTLSAEPLARKSPSPRLTPKC